MIQTREVAIDEPPFDADAAVAAIQAGDMGAFSGLYTHCAPDVHTQLMVMSGGNEALAEDLTQDTFAKALGSIENFTPGTVLGWLRQIARNNYIDHYRRTKRIIIDPLGENIVDVNPFIPPAPFEDEVITRVDLTTYVQQLEENVPGDFYRALEAVDLHDLSYDEAAAMFGIRRATLATRLHRGRKHASGVPVPAGYERKAATPNNP